MAGPSTDDSDETPLDPAVERVRRKLIRFVGINLVLLLVALMAVVGAIVYKWRPAAAPALPVAGSDIPVPAGATIEADIALPAGARIVSQSLSGSRILIDAELADGTRALFLYDIGQRRVVGRFSVVSR